MMKKLMVLALVVGMAGLASAGIVMEAPAQVMAGEQFTISVIGTADMLPDGDLGLDGAVEVPFKWDTAELTSNVKVGATFDSYDAFGSFDYNIGKGSTTTGFTADGTWVTLTFTAGADGDVYTFTRLDSSFAPAETATVSVVPEPMTLGLLGIGGLFLRRRK